MPLTLPYRGEDERDPCRKAIGLFSEIENNFKKKKKKEKGSDESSELNWTNLHDTGIRHTGVTIEGGGRTDMELIGVNGLG